jgi:hypothetical protein
MKRIIYMRADGGLSIVTPVINTHTLVDGQVVPIPEDISEDAAVQRAWEKLPAEAISPQIVEADAVPADRTFRGAWVAGQGGVAFDMKKCREIHRDRMRAARAPRLADLDVRFMRAVENADAAAQKAIAIQKQALRDVTAAAEIDSASTPDALKAVWPECLA